MLKKFLLTSLALLPLTLLAQNSDPKIAQFENGLSPHAIDAIGEKNILQHIFTRMQARKVNGISIAVIEGGKVAWAKGYGLKDAAVTADSVDSKTLFQCASIGKVITAMAALKLVEQGNLSLDQDINEILKSWKLSENNYTANKKVTLRMLLSHSSGLMDNYGFAGYYPGSKLPSLKQILDGQPPANHTKTLQVGTIPGATERYSGGGYLIVQQLIEDASGIGFAEYVKKYILVPLQMDHTTYLHYPDTELKADIARGHDDNGKIDPKRKYNIYPELAAAGPWTTPTDLAKLIIAIQKVRNNKSDALVDTSLIRQMLTPQLNGRGLGVQLKGADGALGFWHAGNNAGFTGVFFGITETGQGAVVLTNSNAGEYLALEAVRSIANAYRWPIMKTIKEQPIDVAPFIGTYQIGGKDALEFTKKKDRLYFSQIGSKTSYRLYRSTDGSFRLIEKADNLKFIFQINDQGKTTGVTMYENAGSKNILLKSS